MLKQTADYVYYNQARDGNDWKFIERVLNLRITILIG